jgi:hypothetical protein
MATEVERSLVPALRKSVPPRNAEVEIVILGEIETGTEGTDLFIDAPSPHNAQSHLLGRKQGSFRIGTLIPGGKISPIFIDLLHVAVDQPDILQWGLELPDHDLKGVFPVHVILRQTR